MMSVVFFKFVRRSQVWFRSLLLWHGCLTGQRMTSAHFNYERPDSKEIVSCCVFKSRRRHERRLPVKMRQESCLPYFQAMLERLSSHSISFWCVWGNFFSAVFVEVFKKVALPAIECKWHTESGKCLNVYWHESGQQTPNELEIRLDLSWHDENV